MLKALNPAVTVSTRAMPVHSMVTLRRKYSTTLSCLPLDDRRMLAVLLTESFKTRQKMGVVDAAREAGSIVGYSDQTQYVT